MSVLHPVGPEEPRTYWLRRGLVIAAIVVVLAVIVTLVVNAFSPGTAVQANPAPPTATAVLAPTPTPSRTPMATGLRTPGTDPSASQKRPATATATPTAKATPSSSTPRPSVTATKKVGPVGCDPAQVRVTLNGKQHLKRKHPNTFQLSLINGSDQTCIASVTRKNFELKIYSGQDRIWSTDDCSTAVKTVKTTLKAQQAVAWKMAWNGRRSRTDCKNRPEVPRAGTYFATAQLKAAKPVQLRMIIRG